MTRKADREFSARVDRALKAQREAELEAKRQEAETDRRTRDALRPQVWVNRHYR